MRLSRYEQETIVANFPDTYKLIEQKERAKQMMIANNKAKGAKGV